MNALNKLEIAQTLCQDLELEIKVTKRFVDGFFEILHETLRTGLAIRLSGFGQFTLRDKPQRIGRNPKTKHPAVITARRVVTFKAGRQLDNALTGLMKPQ